MNENEQNNLIANSILHFIETTMTQFTITAKLDGKKIIDPNLKLSFEYNPNLNKKNFELATKDLIEVVGNLKSEIK